MSQTTDDQCWTEFFDATGDREPRDTVLKALESVAPVGTALDLGCGCGCDTLAMLTHGLHVTAVDAQAEAIRRTTARVHGAGLSDRITTCVGPFEGFRFGTYDLINAGFSVPFCDPDVFGDLWSRILSSLYPGGVFSGQFFGDRDQWAHEEGHHARVFLARPVVDELIGDLERLHFEEVEEDGQTATGQAKHWHLYHMVLRRTAE